MLRKDSDLVGALHPCGETGEGLIVDLEAGVDRFAFRQM
jgi:hypothetical protein